MGAFFKDRGYKPEKHRISSLFRTGNIHDLLNDFVEQTALLGVRSPIIDFFSFTAADDQPAVFQGTQMMRYRRAGHIKHGGNIYNTFLTMA